MKTAIIFATNHGCTEKCSQFLAEKLTNNAAVINLENTEEIDITPFDIIILGGSIHMGMVNKNLKKFIDKNLDLISQKKIGLFLCCMEEGEKAQEQLINAFPEKLRNLAISKGFFGGVFDFEKMNFFEKAIIKKIANIEENYSKINYQNISDFAIEINKMII